MVEEQLDDAHGALVDEEVEQIVQQVASGDEDLEEGSLMNLGLYHRICPDFETYIYPPISEAKPAKL